MRYAILLIIITTLALSIAAGYLSPVNYQGVLF